MSKLISVGSTLLFCALFFSQTSHAAFPDDFSDVTWIDPNISSWARTSNLTVAISGGTMVVDHTRKGSWPVINHSIVGRCCNASVWAFIKRHGRWYASTFEYLRPNQTNKSVSAFDGAHLKRPPFLVSGFDWKPQNGEVYGFMVSGTARFNLNDVNIRERSNVFLYRWGVGPTDNIIFDERPDPTPTPPPPPPEPEPEPVVINFHDYSGTASGVLEVRGPIGNEDLSYSNPVTIRVGDDRSVVFTIDDETFTSTVAQDGSFSGVFHFNLVGECDVSVTVNGVINGRNASGTARATDVCLGNNLNLIASFTASSSTAPDYVDERGDPPNIQGALLLLLGED